MAIATPPPDAAVVPSTVLAAMDLTRRYGEADAAVHALFAIVATLAGMLAAILPARRASRLNVLRALQYE